MMVVMHVQSGRTSDDCGSKSTGGRKRNALLPPHFPLRAAGVFVRSLGSYFSADRERLRQVGRQRSVQTIDNLAGSTA
jgi:hypothetical protein